MNRLGRHYTEESGSKNGKPLRTIYYYYATDREPAVRAGVIAARELQYTFFNDVLVAEVFASTLWDDPTNFDDSKVSLIVQGKTTTAEVIAMLGRPAGRAIYPVADNERERVLVYFYHQVTQVWGVVKDQTFEQSLEITYDKDDVVSKVSYSQSGKQSGKR